MNNVHVLDCTLRDGGYCNDWLFGFENIKKIVAGLVETDIDIIECGFLTTINSCDKDMSRYQELDQIKEILPVKCSGKLFVAMMNYGEYNVADLPVYDGESIDGIRVAFHKKDIEQALCVCNQIKEKGYKVFVQPMVSMSYSDQEFLNLIFKVNEVLPYAFYIVDSFGMMKQNDLARYYYIVENNLNNEIKMGFHSHNNLQLAYSNAQFLIGKNTNRHIIIDSSIYGMGRGAGNLNTELFIQYLNENRNTNYQIKPLLGIIDEILSDFYQRNYWGYSLPNYISAIHNAHPNYAGYLDDKKTLTVEDMNEIFEDMDEEKRYSYDKEYIEELYISYMTNGKVQVARQQELKDILLNRRIILIAPGKSSSEQRDLIINTAINTNSILISVNHDYSYVDVDYIFLSNLRRYRELDKQKRAKCIVTSNIPTEDVFLKTEYKNLVSEIDVVRDNAGMMAIKFLMNYGVSEIMLAGFDGYSHDVEENYAENQHGFITKNVILDAMNEGMTKILNEYAKKIKITFLTEAKYVTI